MHLLHHSVHVASGQFRTATKRLSAARGPACLFLYSPSPTALTRWSNQETAAPCPSTTHWHRNGAALQPEVIASGGRNMERLTKLYANSAFHCAGWQVNQKYRRIILPWSVWMCPLLTCAGFDYRVCVRTRKGFNRLIENALPTSVWPSSIK
jgi:hypothetical protein